MGKRGKVTNAEQSFCAEEEKVMEWGSGGDLEWSGEDEKMGWETDNLK